MRSIQRAIRKADQKQKKEQDRICNIISAACFIVLWEDYGWREKRIITRFDQATAVMHEVPEKHRSVFEILEDETGIEMSLDGEKSYHEYHSLTSDETIVEIDTIEKYIANSQRQTKWIPTLIITSLCIVLHRVDGWEYDKLSRFVYKVNTLRNLLGEYEKPYDDYLQHISGHSMKELWG